MPQLTLVGPPRVAVGGRWQEIEEENRTLASELQEWHREALSAQADIVAVRHEERALELESAASEKICQQSIQEVREFHSEVAFLRRALAEGAEASAELQDRVTELSTARESLSVGCASLQQRFGAEESEAAQLRVFVSQAELRASREEGGRLEAEARRDCLQVELNVAEGRLINRGTHVDLLLRDKERLWGQLARARRGAGASEDVKEAPRTPQKNEERPPAAAGHARPRSASSSACSTPTKGPCRRGPCASTGKEGKSSPSHDARCLELQQQLWHLQRALERERASHEQARESLRVRGWRSDKPGSRDMPAQGDDCR